MFLRGVGECIAACAERPPSSFLGHLGREVRTLLADGITPDRVRAALVLHRPKGLHPSTLPSLVNEVMNADTSRSTPLRAWTNPSDATAAYGGQL